jgi:hypothetical protein
MKKDLLQGALLVVEAVAAAGALAAVNQAKTNTTRGTYALMVKKDPAGNPTGEGGVDLDVALGAALVLVAAVAPSGIAPHLAALGAGGLACYGARKGAEYGAKRAAANTDQTHAGIPGYTNYGSLSGYTPRWGQPLGQIDGYVAGFGNAQPVYAAYGQG